MPTIRCVLVSTFLAGAFASSVFGENWPGYRGPRGSGISSEAGVPLSCSETENLVWKTELPGPGSSSPIVWGDRVFVTAYSGYGDDSSDGDLLTLDRHLLCLSVTDGTIIWQKKFPAPLPEDTYEGFISEHGYASHTPVTDGENIYAFFGKGGLIAFDFEGNELWKKDLGSRLSSKGWGSSSSPILHGDSVIVNANEESNSLYAFNKTTGDEVWNWQSDSLVSIYGTPVIATTEDRTDLIVGVPVEVWGMNPETGKLRWFVTTGLT